MSEYNQSLYPVLISGSGGGAAPEKTHTPVEQPNTLQSVVKGRILDLIAYGPIYGLADGLKSVYLDNTPVMNADGSVNFQGITLETREGFPVQSVINGFTAIENSIEVGTDVLFDAPPVRSVTNNDADAALITVQLASLVQQAENGDSVQASVSVLIDVRSGNGSWVNGVSDTITGKTTSPYPRTYRVNLKDFGPPPYDVRVRRGNKESEDAKLQDKLVWTLINEVIDSRLYYPNMALVGITVDSKLFGSSLPSRMYDMKLSIVKVPTNYDPDTRQYTGIWDGNFKEAWTDNPAWCFYDLATHPVIGGDLENVDKWWLYSIGKYCDELVPDGYGNLEPRFTCNTIFAAQEDATAALNTFASCFRGMTYWGTNTMVPVADMPAAIKKIVGPSSIEGGDFEYVGTSIRERHSVCVVMWNDPDDYGKAVPEVYEDPDSIEAYGWVEVRVTAVACNSRGQARRLAKWILYSERMETQTLTYTAALDHADLRPGELIEVADPYYQGPRMHGRIIEATSVRVVLDQVPDSSALALSGSWFLSAMMPNGEIGRAEVSSFQGNAAVLLTSLPDTPEPGFVWALSSTALELPQFRVVSVVEDGPRYKVTATEYDPRKYGIVEFDLVLPERPTSLLPSGSISPPLDLSFEAYKYLAGGSEHQGLLISWTPPKDPRVDSYMLDVMEPGSLSFRTVYQGPGLSYDLLDAIGGQWVVRVRAVSYGIPSPWVSRTVQIASLLLPVAPDSVEVQVGTFSVTLAPKSAYPAQLWEFWRSLAPLEQGQIEVNATQLPTGTYLVDAALRANKLYYYYVRGVNQYGKSAWYAVQAQTLNDFDDIINSVRDEIVEGELFEVINSRIELVATGAATEAAQEAIDAALAGIQDQIDNLTDALAYHPEEPYAKNAVVRQGNELYQAKGPVPADVSGANAPPNSTYWESVATILEDAAGVVIQVDQLTTDIQELEGVVTSSASRLQSLQASTRRLDEDETDLIDVASRYESNARFTESIKVISEEGKATVTRLESLQSVVNQNKAEVTTLTQTVATLEETTAIRIQTLTAGYNENKSAIVTEQTARSNADQALTTSLNSLTATYNSNKTITDAAIVSEQTARANADQALTTSLTTLSASYTSNKTSTDAAIQAEQTARANADSAITTSLSTLSSTVGGNTSAIQTVQTTVATNKNELKALYAVKLQLTSDGRTYAAGMGLDITTNGGITQSQILFQANRIAMINTDSGNVSLPFLMEAGTVYLNSTMIKFASINFAQITDTLQSSDYQANTSGWKLPKTGPWELNGSAADGRRMTIANSAIRLYHANGVLGIDIAL